MEAITNNISFKLQEAIDKEVESTLATDDQRTQSLHEALTNEIQDT
jgi:hypothetical protein